MSTDKKTSKLKTAIVSLIAAILVWAGITYIDPPLITTTISNLPVRFTGEEELRERGFTVVDRSGITGLSVRVEGRKNDLLSLSGGIFVEVDVSSIESEGVYQLAGNVTLPSGGLSIEDVRFDTVPVKVDRISMKDIPIRVNQTGSISGRLVRTTPEDDYVTITGAKSEIDAVEYGEAAVNISSLTEDSSIESGYVLMGADDAPIENNETISASKTRININCRLYDAVTLPVRAALSNELSGDYVIDRNNLSVTPSTVEVGLTDMSIKSVRAIVTNTDATEECELIEAEGMYIPESVKTVRVKAAVLKKETKNITLNVEAENLSDGLTAQTGTVTVTASGAADKLVSENFSASVDLSGLAAGTYNLPVTIQSDDAQITGAYSVSVTIS